MPIVDDEIKNLQTSMIKKEHTVLYNTVCSFFEKNYGGENINFKESLYLYSKDLLEKPKCLCCGKSVRFISVFKGYVKFCSNQCSGKYKKTLSKEEKDLITNKRKESVRNLYGVDNVAKSSDIKNKTKNTNIGKYGAVTPLLNENIKKKRDETFLEKWGGHPLSNGDKIKERSFTRKNTMAEKWLTSVAEKLDNYDICEYDIDNRMVKIKCKNCSFEHFYSYDTIKQRRDYKNLCYKCFPLYSSKPNKNRKIIEKYNNLNNDINVISYDKSSLTCTHLSKNHDFIINIKNFYDRFKDNIEICTVCYPLSDNSSIKETEVVNFLKEIGVDFICGDREVLNGKELDIYIPSHNLAIEFNGLYWHSEKFKDKNYHLDKSIKCQERGVHLLHIWEDEWVFKKDIIKSIIINKLGLIENRIYARQCVVKEVLDIKAIRSFLDDNHIQGYCQSSIKLGLYFNDELISLMTFGYRHTNSKKEFELIRFCNKKYCNVIGASSKIFNYFKNNYEFNDIISYSDFRLFDGKMYETLGFIKKHLSKPDYFWCKNLERKHRFNFNKRKLVKDGYDSNKTEVEIMHELEYYRVFGCGQFRWIYSK